MDASERAATLEAVAAEAAGCVRCPLAGGRTQVVFGEGSADAELALVGEAPGFHEDREGTPFAGRARELLERLLGGVGLSLDEVYLATVLKCRPPGNRDPLPEEAAACEPYLFRQLELVRPRVVATLGSFATALLSGRALGITRVHGQEQDVTLGGRPVTLYPLYHPAAALYTPTMLDVLEQDVARLPALLSRGAASPRRSSTASQAPVTDEEPAHRQPGAARPLLISSMPVVEVETRSAEETEALAGRLARRLSPGDVVLVSGELGAGKTTFVRGACRALGVTARVTSPTFTIGHRYAGSVDVSHLDLYRFRGLSAAEWGDLEPYFEDAVVFVEWPEAGLSALPAARAHVTLEHVSQGDTAGCGRRRRRDAARRSRGC